MRSHPLRSKFLATIAVLLFPVVQIFPAPDPASLPVGAFTPQQFGAKADGNTDDTSAVQAAIDTAISKHGTTMLNGRYRVQSVKIQNANGFHLFCLGASLLGMKSGTFPAVLEIKNSSDVSITGKLTVSAQYNQDYETGIWVGAENQKGVSKLDIYSVNVTGAKVAWRFGSASSNKLVSEITIHGGSTYGCPSVIEAYGHETVVNFVGSNLLSDSLGGKDDWKRLPATAVKVTGGSVIVTGGELQHNMDAHGALIVNEPMADPRTWTSYGRIYVSNAAIETAAPLIITANPSELDAQDTGVVSVHNCFGYHSQDAMPFVKTDSKYAGWVIMKDNNFYAGRKRTHLNIEASPTTRIDVDVKSFSKNFKQDATGISGGIFQEKQ